MEKTIEFYYGKTLHAIKKISNHYYFESEGEMFFFVPFNKASSVLNEIMQVSHELKQKKIEVHDIVMNKNGELMTIVNDVNYILLKINGELNQKFDIFDIIKLNDRLTLQNTKTQLYRNDWASLWSSKVDYLEYQIRELGKNKRILLETFSYYIGLAENAIAYVIKTTNSFAISSLEKVTLCHSRLYYPNYKLNYMNPLNFIFDLEIRDISEYLKHMFFSDDDAFRELQIYLSRKKLSRFGYQMLYARLLYPSYYFDIFESIMNNEESEKKLLRIVDRVNEYESFLKNVFYELERYSMMEQIDWLIVK